MLVRVVSSIMGSTYPSFFLSQEAEVSGPEDANAVEYEFMKEETLGGPYEAALLRRKKTVSSGFRIAKDRAMQEARLRGLRVDAKCEIQLDIHGYAELSHPVIDKYGDLITPALQIYQLPHECFRKDTI